MKTVVECKNGNLYEIQLRRNEVIKISSINKKKNLSIATIIKGKIS